MSGKPVPSKYRVELGLRLKKSRMNLFKTAKDCADKYDVSPSMWSDMEKGRVVFSPEKIIHLADFLNVDPGWLLTGSQTKKTPPETGEVFDESANIPELLALAGTISLTVQALIISVSKGQNKSNDVLNLMERIVKVIEKDQVSQGVDSVKISGGAI